MEVFEIAKALAKHKLSLFLITYMLFLLRINSLKLIALPSTAENVLP